MCSFPCFLPIVTQGQLISMSGVVQILMRVAWVKKMTRVVWVHKVLACMAWVL